ncbi:hypothetical protein MHYP_G00359960 [Metynnis hypsauchen]
MRKGCSSASQFSREPQRAGTLLHSAAQCSGEHHRVGTLIYYTALCSREHSKQTLCPTVSPSALENNSELVPCLITLLSVLVSSKEPAIAPVCSMWQHRLQRLTSHFVPELDTL